jgi:hypothetical protein
MMPRRSSLLEISPAASLTPAAALLRTLGGADVPPTNRELQQHTDEQRDNQCAEQAEPRILLEPSADQRRDERHDGDE